MSLGKRAGGFDYNDDAKRLMMAGGGGMMPNAYGLPNYGGGMAMPGFGGAGLGGFDPSYAYTDPAFAQIAVASGQVVSVMAQNTEMGGGHCKTIVKVFVPLTTPLGESRGKLLGQRGAMLKQLQSEAGCKMAIRGRGSSKQEEQKPQHMQEQLHVQVEFEGPVVMRDTTLSNAEMLIRAVLTPATDPQAGQHAVSQYEVMKQQLQQTYGSAYGMPPPQQLPHAGLPSLGGDGGAAGGGSLQSFSDPSYASIAVASGQIVSVMATNTETGGGQCKATVKIFIPTQTVMGESRGKLLGQRGSMIKQLTAESGCQLAIRGRGSSKSEDMKPAHLSEQLHVLCEYEGPVAMRDTQLNNAEMLIRAVLTPNSEPEAGKHVISQYEAMKQ